MLPRKNAHNSESVVSGRDGLDRVDHNPRSLECDNRMGRWERIRYFPCTDQHARNRWLCDGPGS
jgi:hypothetical protein